MEPKYYLVYDTNGHYSDPFAIYEQMATKVPPKEVEVGMGLFYENEQPDAISQRLHSRYDRIESALKALCHLNDGQPIVLAYSTKPVDNTFTV